MSFKRIPFIPMSPSSLPHRRGHDVVRLPVRQIITWLSVIREAEYELRPVFRTVCLLTLRGHFPSHIFESLFWRFVADA